MYTNQRCKRTERLEYKRQGTLQYGKVCRGTWLWCIAQGGWCCPTSVDCGRESTGPTKKMAGYWFNDQAAFIFGGRRSRWRTQRDVCPCLPPAWSVWITRDKRGAGVAGSSQDNSAVGVPSQSGVAVVFSARSSAMVESLSASSTVAMA